MRQTNQPGVVMQPGSGQQLMANAGPVGFQPTSSNKKVPGLLGLAIVHMVLGFVSTVLGIAAIVIQSNYSYYGWGLWSGVLFFGVTGVLGVVGATRNSNKGWVIAFMVMSIISAAVAFQLMVAFTVAATNESFYICRPLLYTPYNYDGPCFSNRSARQAVDALLAITGLAEMVIAILSSSLTCYGICTCCQPYSPVTVHYVPQQAMTQLVPMMPMEAQQRQQQQQQHQGQQFQQGQQLQQGQQFQQGQQLQQGQPQQFVAVNTQQQARAQQAPVQVPTVVQGTQINSQYAPNYRATPPQQMIIAPQPQPVAIAVPQQVVMSVPSQTAPAAPVQAEAPGTYPDQSGVTGPSDTEHFHHDDKEGLLETA